MTRDLRTTAELAMKARGFLVRFPEEVHEQLHKEHEPPFETLNIRDLSSWFWSSIDNDDSRDLDQIEYANREGKRHACLRWHCGCGLVCADSLSARSGCRAEHHFGLYRRRDLHDAAAGAVHGSEFIERGREAACDGCRAAGLGGWRRNGRYCLSGNRGEQGAVDLQRRGRVA